MKKKVYCWHCLFYLPETRGWSADGYATRVNDKCLHPSAFGTEKVKATHAKPAHDRHITYSPAELNRNNTCRGFTQGMHSSRLEDKKQKKTWWKLW